LGSTLNAKPIYSLRDFEKMKMGRALLLMMLASFGITYWLSMTLLLRSNATNNLNKLYQALLMAFWMGVVMALLGRDWRTAALLGAPVLILSVAIREQWFVGEREFAKSMIEHHQMAIDMTRLAQPKLKDPRLARIGDDILRTQQQEIDQFYQFLRQ
jgi:hypothetical protein